MNPRRTVLTWHVHGTYLQMLGHVGHDFVVPVRQGRPPGHGGLPPGRRWPEGLREVEVTDIPSLDLDCILFQSDENWWVDQYEILTPEQRRLPRLYLEHDPPGHDGTSCFETRHPVDDPAVVVVHVTHFNDLMWNTGEVPTTVIEHAVTDPGLLYTGELERGLVVVNNLGLRGRRLGRDVYENVRERVPLDLVGMGSTELGGGLGEVPPDELASFAARYRFFFHPIRYTSLGLALVEAMMAGMPVVALATTEAVSVIDDGVEGFISTDVDRLIDGMRALIDDRTRAAEMGRAARRTARRRFSTERFASDWYRLILERTGDHLAGAGAAPSRFGRLSPG